MKLLFPFAVYEIQAKYYDKKLSEIVHKIQIIFKDFFYKYNFVKKTKTFLISNTIYI